MVTSLGSERYRVISLGLEAMVQLLNDRFSDFEATQTQLAEDGACAGAIGTLILVVIPKP